MGINGWIENFPIWCTTDLCLKLFWEKKVPDDVLGIYWQKKKNEDKDSSP